jgi:hypothetical protein
LHFEYQLIRLFDFQTREYYDNHDPIVKILLPKMNYKPEERTEVIRQAYLGLFMLAAPMLFDKYVDFIDVYAEIRDEEREAIYRLMTEREETAMLAQYIKDKGFQAGRKTGRKARRKIGREAGGKMWPPGEDTDPSFWSTAGVGETSPGVCVVGTVGPVGRAGARSEVPSGSVGRI